MVDYCGMPAEGHRAWPGRMEADQLPHHDKGEHVAQQILADLRETRPGEQRFVPFVTMYEFEGLLFSDCEAFAQALAMPDLAGPLLAIRNQFDSPEHINDAPETAPSKRILALHPAYAKIAQGAAAARTVTLSTMAEQCPHFAGWLRRLEALGHGP